MRSISAACSLLLAAPPSFGAERNLRDRLRGEDTEVRRVLAADQTKWKYAFIWAWGDSAVVALRHPIREGGGPVEKVWNNLWLFTPTTPHGKDAIRGAQIILLSSTTPASRKTIADGGPTPPQATCAANLLGGARIIDERPERQMASQTEFACQTLDDKLRDLGVPNRFHAEIRSYLLREKGE